MYHRILQAAAAELNERGIKFTVDSVAARLGISKKTLYQHISSKEALIHAVVEAALDDVAAQERDVLAADMAISDRLKILLTIEPKMFGPINNWVYEDLKRSCPNEWTSVECYRENKMHMIAGLLSDGTAGNEVRPINALLAAHALRGAMTELMNFEFLTKNNLSFHQALESVSDIFLHGILRKDGDCRE